MAGTSKNQFLRFCLFKTLLPKTKNEQNKHMPSNLGMPATWLMSLVFHPVGTPSIILQSFIHGSIPFFDTCQVMVSRFEQGCSSLTDSPTHPRTHARTHSLLPAFTPAFVQPTPGPEHHIANSGCSVPHGPNHTARYDAVGHAWTRTYPRSPSSGCSGPHLDRNSISRAPLWVTPGPEQMPQRMPDRKNRCQTECQNRCQK